MEKKELTAADVWAMFAETDRKIAENDRILTGRFAETDRIVKETAAMQKENAIQIEETGRQIEETGKQIKETGKQIEELKESLKELGVQVGGIGKNQGYHAEQFFQDVFKKKLEFGMVKYDEMVPNFAYKKSRGGQIEFDIALINGNSIALIEVKNRIHPNFVIALAEERVEKFREFFPEYGNYAVYLGIAGFSFSDEVLDRASSYGIGIIKQVGEGVEVKADNLKAY